MGRERWNKTQYNHHRTEGDSPHHGTSAPRAIAPVSKVPEQAFCREAADGDGNETEGKKCEAGETANAEAKVSEPDISDDLAGLGLDGELSLDSWAAEDWKR